MSAVRTAVCVPTCAICAEQVEAFRQYSPELAACAAAAVRVFAIMAPFIQLLPSAALRQLAAEK